MAKGGAYEREICKEFSSWWSDGRRDDIFWRTSNSGGRATVRLKAGKQTEGQHGDMGATDPSGLPLLDVVTIEIKRGYSKASIHDSLDKLATAAKQQFEIWLAKVKEDMEASGSYAWLLVTKRDRRQALVWMPRYLHTRLQWPKKERVWIRAKDDAGNNIIGMRLVDFFDLDPSLILRLQKEV